MRIGKLSCPRHFYSWGRDGGFIYMCVPCQYITYRCIDARPELIRYIRSGMETT